MQRRFRTLADLPAGQSARAIQFNDPVLASKLTAMGVLPGVLIELVRPAPFGQAFYVKVDGTRMALRQSEAASILVEL